MVQCCLDDVIHSGQVGLSIRHCRNSEEFDDAPTLPEEQFAAALAVKWLFVFELVPGRSINGVGEVYAHGGKSGS